MLRVKFAATTMIIGDGEGKRRVRLPKKFGYTPAEVFIGWFRGGALRWCIIWRIKALLKNDCILRVSCI